MIDGSNVRYVQFNTPQGIGNACFVINWNRDNGELGYRAGSAFCSPKDCFSKQIARDIAAGRAMRNFQSGKILSDKTGYVTHDEFALILAELFNKTDFTIIPGWARRSFSRGKYTIGLTRINKPSSEDMKVWKEVFDEIKHDKAFKVIVHPAISRS